MNAKPYLTGIFMVFMGLLVTALTPASDLAFTNVNLGEAVPDLQLSQLDGGVESYLGLEDDQVSVFAIVKAEHQRSEHLINQWADLKTAFADEPVHWALIISDRNDPDHSANWDSLAPGTKILVDAGDQLYGLLGVALTPTVGIVDQQGLLRAYLPYRKINYPVVISAHLNLVLGKINQQEFQKIMEPSGHATDSLQAGAKRKLKLARMLLKRDRLEPALKQVESALEDCPEMQDAYLLLAQIHQVAGRTDEAARAEDQAKQFSVSFADTMGISVGDGIPDSTENDQK